MAIPTSGGLWQETSKVFLISGQIATKWLLVGHQQQDRLVLYRYMASKDSIITVLCFFFCCLLLLCSFDGVQADQTNHFAGPIMPRQTFFLSKALCLKARKF